MNKPTPETDVNQVVAIKLYTSLNARIQHHLNFARKLERERDEARTRGGELMHAIHDLTAERDQLIKVVDELANNRIVENILADGRPHGSNRTYPDGCECDDCTTYDQLTKALATYSQLPHVKAKGKWKD